MLMPGSHSQLGELVGVVGGRKRRMVNVCLPVVCLEPMTHRSRAQTTWPPGIRTHTCMHPHMHAQISLLQCLATVRTPAPGREQLSGRVVKLSEAIE